MGIFLVVLGILLILGLPALLIITACISASRTSRHEENARISTNMSSLT